MSHSVLGVIGGTGLNRLAAVTRPAGRIDTPYGPASADPQIGVVGAKRVIFLARHGQPHRLAPHLINYRANLWLLRELGATAVVATNAVGSIAPAMTPGDLVIPDQIIDYTWGRLHTYMDSQPLQHVDFSVPYDAQLRGGCGRPRSTSSSTARSSTPACMAAPRDPASRALRRSIGWRATAAMSLA